MTHPAIGRPDELAFRICGLSIVRDTREQPDKSWDASFDGLPIVNAALPSGDWSVTSMETELALERKAADDYVGCIIGPRREPFIRELERLATYKRAAIVVESHFDAIATGAYYSKVKPAVIVASVASIHARYGVPVLFIGDRKRAGDFARTWLVKMAKHLRAQRNEAA